MFGRRKEQTPKMAKLMLHESIVDMSVGSKRSELRLLRITSSIMHIFYHESGASKIRSQEVVLPDDPAIVATGYELGSALLFC